MSAVWRSVGARLRGLADALASVVVPAPCRICDRVLDNASRIPICRDCLDSLSEYTGPMCGRCGLPLVSPLGLDPAALCHVCRRGLYDFECARSYGVYGEKMVRTIVLLKYHQVAPLGGWFARRIYDMSRHYGEMFFADAVVPVPIHPLRLRERGYNQAELIARPLSRLLGLSMRSCLLARVKPRPEKLHLTVRERWKAARGAYAAREGAQVDKLRVLLVDDVMTTGATLDACSRALRAAGASRVTALVAARAIPQALGSGAEPAGGRAE